MGSTCSVVAGAGCGGGTRGGQGVRVVGVLRAAVDVPVRTLRQPGGAALEDHEPRPAVRVLALGPVPDAGAGEVEDARLGEILDVAIKVYTRNAATLFRIVAIVIIPVQVIGLFIILSTFPDSLADAQANPFLPDPNAPVPEVDFGEVGVFFVGTALVWLLNFIGVTLATGACFKAVTDAYLGAKSEWRSSMRFALQHLPSLLWVTFLVTLVSVIGLVFCLAPGIWMWAALAVATPALLTEGQKGTKAMGRSFSLVQNRWWNTFAVLLIAFALAASALVDSAREVGILLAAIAAVLLFGYWALLRMPEERAVGRGDVGPRLLGVAVGAVVRPEHDLFRIRVAKRRAIEVANEILGRAVAGGRAALREISRWTHARDARIRPPKIVAPGKVLRGMGRGVGGAPNRMKTLGPRGRNVILFFYPKDDTPGCTLEAQEFRDAHPRFEAIDTVVLGISPDGVKSHQKFRKKFENESFRYPDPAQLKIEKTLPEPVVACNSGYRNAGELSTSRRAPRSASGHAQCRVDRDEQRVRLDGVAAQPLELVEQDHLVDVVARQPIHNDGEAARHVERLLLRRAGLGRRRLEGRRERGRRRGGAGGG